VLVSWVAWPRVPPFETGTLGPWSGLRRHRPKAARSAVRPYIGALCPPRTWRKLHIGVDAGTGEIVAVELTAHDVDDGGRSALCSTR
jgi:hypothetical protein